MTANRLILEVQDALDRRARHIFIVADTLLFEEAAPTLLQLLADETTRAERYLRALNLMAGEPKP